jgi:hypothetical protein
MLVSARESAAAALDVVDTGVDAVEEREWPDEENKEENYQLHVAIVASRYDQDNSTFS